jgi:hypothetical protein
VPIIIQAIDDYVRENESAINPVPRRNGSAFNAWAVTLVFNIIFVVMHRANYPDKFDLMNPVFVMLIFGVNLPWTLVCVRDYITVPDTSGTRAFCIVYDTIIQKPFFRNHVLLIFFAVLGFYRSSYFTLMLLDIFNISPVVSNIIKCITKPAVELGVVGYLFIITLIIYATFGLEHFPTYLKIGDDDTLGSGKDKSAEGRSGACHSVISCFMAFVQRALPNGNIDKVMNSADNQTDGYFGRIVYDILFFIWVMVLLFNIIAGLMLDTFASIREEAQVGHEC